MEHKTPILKGVSFGAVTSLITALGSVIGIYAGTGSKPIILGGLLSIAIADSLADAFGIQLSEESDKKKTLKSTWISTFATFVSKFSVAALIALPVILFNLATAIVFTIILGSIILIALDFLIAHQRHTPFWKLLARHGSIAVGIVFLTYILGKFIKPLIS